MIADKESHNMHFERPKFLWQFSLANLVEIATILLLGFLIYAGMMRDLEDHSGRLTGLEGRMPELQASITLAQRQADLNRQALDQIDRVMVTDVINRLERIESKQAEMREVIARMAGEADR